MKMNKAEKTIYRMIKEGMNADMPIYEIEAEIQEMLDDKFSRQFKKIPPEYKNAAKKYGVLINDDRYELLTTQQNRVEKVLDRLDHMKQTMRYEDMIDKMREDLRRWDKERISIV